MTAGRCECACLGCEHFCAQDPPAEGRDAHHTRLLLALDLSIAVACRARGIPACNGQDDPHAADGCSIGTLHTRAAELAIALAQVLDDPQGPSPFSRESFDRAHEALEQLMLELAEATGPRRVRPVDAARADGEDVKR